MRRLRFSLQTLTAVMLVIAAFLGYWHHKATQKRMLTDSIHKKGGSVYWSEPSLPLVPPQIAKRLPREYCCVPLNLDTVEITDDELSSIAQLFPTVESIGFERPALGDKGFSLLSRLDSLTQLRLYGDRLPDLSSLAACRRLAQLDIDSRDFDDDRLARLKRIPSLQTLMLFQTPVTPEGLAVAKERMPRCEIVVFSNGHTDSEQFATLQYDPIEETFVRFDASKSGAVREFATPQAK